MQDLGIFGSSRIINRGFLSSTIITLQIQEVWNSGNQSNFQNSILLLRKNLCRFFIFRELTLSMGSKNLALSTTVKANAEKWTSPKYRESPVNPKTIVKMILLKLCWVFSSKLFSSDIFSTDKILSGSLMTKMQLVLVTKASRIQILLFRICFMNYLFYDYDSL